MSKLGVAGDLVGKWGRFAGPALAPLSIYGGIRDMVNPEHDGLRGAGDRFAGAMGVVSGIGTLAMAAGACRDPGGYRYCGGGRNHCRRLGFGQHDR